MKWFYPALFLVVAVMVTSPFLFLYGETREIGAVVVGWDEESGRPIEKADPIVLYNSWGSAIKSRDPATAGDTTSATLLGHIFEGLYTYHFLKRPASEDTIVPQLAAGMPKISGDKLTYTIPIQEGILYHRNPCFGKRLPDGRWPTREVKAKDFVLSFKRIADFHVNTQLSWTFLDQRILGLNEFRDKTEDEYTKAQFERYVLPVEGVRALDDRTLQIRLTKPYPQFMLVLAMNSYAPIPREAVDYWLKGSDPLTTEFDDRESLVGTGPYILEVYKPKNRLLFVRNPDFRKQYYPREGEPAHGDYPGDRALGLLDDAGKRVPFIDAIEWTWMPESFSSWMAFQAKRLDVAGIPRETFEFVTTPGKELSEEWAKRGAYMRTYSAPTVYWIVFNMRDPVLGASRSLRQAICLAFDVENYIKVLYNGRGKRATNIIPSSFPAHEAAGPGPYYVPHTQENREELRRRVAEKIEEAKRELRAAGQLEANGEIPALKLEMSKGDRAVQVGEFFQQQFDKAGLRLEPVYNDWPTLQTKVQNKKAQLYTMGWHADYPDAENFLQLFYGPNIETGTNNANYDDPQFNRWYEQARALFPGEQRMNLYVKMVRKLSEDVPVLLLSEPTSYVLYYEWVKNAKSHPIGYGYSRYRRIDQELRRKMGGRSE